jgi:hypothetical protein
VKSNFLKKFQNSRFKIEVSNLIEQLPNALVVHLNEKNEQIELELENNEYINAECNIL